MLLDHGPLFTVFHLISLPDVTALLAASANCRMHHATANADAPTSGYKTKGDGEQVSYGEVVSFMSSAYHGMAINYSVGIITEQSMLPVEVNCTRTAMLSQCLEHGCFRCQAHVANSHRVSSSGEP